MGSCESKIKPVSWIKYYNFRITKFGPTLAEMTANKIKYKKDIVALLFDKLNDTAYLVADLTAELKSFDC